MFVLSIRSNASTQQSLLKISSESAGIPSFIGNELTPGASNCVSIMKEISIDQVKGKIEERFWSKIKFGSIDECWEWQRSLNSNGYGWHRIKNENNEWVMTTAHRHLFKIIFGTLPSDIFVCHKCDNKRCCNPNHLFSGTVQDNIDDMVYKRRNKFGESHHNSKLKNSDILIIRNKISNGEKQSEIAKLFGVSKSRISFINTKKNWAHL